MNTEAAGSRVVVFHRYDVTSYAMARMKADGLNYYRSNSPHVLEENITTEHQLRARIRPGGPAHHLVVEGGKWWQTVQREIAKRDGAKQAKRREQIETALTDNVT